MRFLANLHGNRCTHVYKKHPQQFDVKLSKENPRLST